MLMLLLFKRVRVGVRVREEGEDREMVSAEWLRGIEWMD